MNRLRFLFRSPQPVPPALGQVFRRIFMDIAWFGVINGSTASFITIYATRLGASATQVGLLTAVPAMINLLVALPAGRFLERRPQVGNIVFWTAVLTRFFYLPLVFLPTIIHNSQAQIWMVLLITLVMNIPATVLIVGFNAMFAEIVPPEWRGYVQGVRNALLSIVTVVTALVSGWILVTVSFPVGYQIVFAIGFIGVALSTVQLFHLRHVRMTPANGGPAMLLPAGVPQRRGGLRLATAFTSLNLARLDILKTPYGRVIGLLFFFHFAQYLAIPIFSLYTVNELRFSDQVLSIGSSLFSGLVFLGSLQLARVSRRLGNKRVTGLGVVLLGIYPFMVSFAQPVWLYYLASMIGGIAWSLAGGALYNYLLERIPDDQRPPYLAWYNLALNAAILAGSLGAVPIAEAIGYGGALILFGILRAAAGLAILKWG